MKSTITHQPASLVAPHAFPFLETLEPRIAPASLLAGEKPFLNESGFTSPPVGTPILLRAGEGLASANVGGSYMLYVEKGMALVFTTDLNGNGRIDFNEITGIAAGDGLRLISFVDINGDIVTNLNPDGTLTDSDGDRANGLDGKIVLPSRIESITMRSITQADINTDIPGNTVANRYAPSSYSINGNIYAGGGLGTSSSYGLTIDTADAAIADGLLPNFGFIKTGTATSNQSFSFGYGIDGSSTILDPQGNTISLRNETVEFIPGIGQVGGDVIGVRSGQGFPVGFPGEGSSEPVPFTIMGILTGDGGIGARGGDIRNVTVLGDVGGLKLIAGNGGFGESGGAGGSIVNFNDFGSLNAEVILRTGNGGEGFLGPSGKAGDISIGVIDTNALAQIGLGNGGNALGKAGTGTSLTSAEIRFTPGADNFSPVALVGTYRIPGSISTTAATDFSGGGVSNLVVLYDSPDRLFVSEIDSEGFEFNRTYLDSISYAPLSERSSGIVVGDFNGDGILDIVTASSYGTNFTGIITYLGDGEGGFLPPRFSPLPMSVFSDVKTVSPWAKFSVTDITAFDYDQDGLSDLAIIREITSDGLKSGVTPLTTPGTRTELIALRNAGDGYFFADYGMVDGKATMQPYSILHNGIGESWDMISLSTRQTDPFFSDPEAIEAIALTKTSGSTGVINVRAFALDPDEPDQPRSWTTLASAKMVGPENTLYIPTGIAAADLNSDLNYDLVASNSSFWTSPAGIPYQASTFAGTAEGKLSARGIVSLGAGVTPQAVVGGMFAFESFGSEEVGSFIKNTSSGLLTLGATTYEGGNPNQSIAGLTYSGNGASLGFSTKADNILPPGEDGKVPNLGGFENIYIQQVGKAATVQLVSAGVADSGAPIFANGNSSNPSINPANSKLVIFQSAATNLVAGDDEGFVDIFLKNLSNQSVQRISTSELGAPGNGDSVNPSYSNSGNFVVFQSDANNLVSLNLGQFTSFQIDSNGDQHITYYDATDGDLRYARGSSGVWTTDIIDQSGNVGQYNSLALSSDNRPFVSYYDATNGDLKLAWVDTDGAWQNQTVLSADNVGQYTALVLAGDLPHIAYYNVTLSDFQFVAFNGTNWSSPVTIDAAGDVGKYASMAYDATNDILHASYFNATTAKLKYAQSTDGGSTWTGGTTPLPKVVDPSQSNGLFTSIAVSAAGDVGISYINSTAGSLRFAFGTSGGDFTGGIETIETGIGAGTGASREFQSTSLRFDGIVPLVSFAFFGAEGTNLQVAQKQGPEWEVQNATTVEGTGLFSSLALDAAGNPEVAYYNSIEGSLQFVKRTGAANWSAPFTIDSGDVDQNGFTDIYVKQLSTGRVWLASLATNGVQPNAASFDPAIVEVGSTVFVAFTSTATNLDGSPGDGTAQIYVKNLSTGQLQLVSATDGPAEPGNADSGKAAFSGNGARIAFQSIATNLGLSDDGTQQIYVKDWQSGGVVAGINTGVIRTASVNDFGQPGDADSMNPKLNSKGTMVVFASDATNLVFGDTNNRRDIFTHTIAGQETERISVSTVDRQSTGNSDFPIFNPSNSSIVLFASDATNLIGTQFAFYLTGNNTSYATIKLNGYSDSNRTELFRGGLYTEVNTGLVVFDSYAGFVFNQFGDRPHGLATAGPAIGISGSARNIINFRFEGEPGGIIAPYQTSFSIRAGQGGNSYLGSGGSGGSIGSGLIGDFAVPSIVFGQTNIQFAAGGAGNGYINGGNAGSVSGFASGPGQFAATLTIFTGNGGIGLTGTGGSGGEISAFRTAASSTAFFTGSGGNGNQGGSGGSIQGAGTAGVPDLTTNSLLLITGKGGNGMAGGGSGGNIGSVVPQMLTATIPGSRVLEMIAGPGGNAIGGSGGSGGNITNNSPYALVNTFGGNVTLATGLGGNGLSGGAGGNIDRFINSPTGSNVLSSISFVAGNGGTGVVGNGGAGGFIRNVTASGTGLGQGEFDNEFARFVAGDGGNSFAGRGGTGGSISSVNSTASTASMAIAAGMGGTGLLQGGQGGALSAITANAAGQTQENAKLILMAGHGGDAYAAAPPPQGPRNAPTPIVDHIRTLERFGGKDGIGGNGGNISNITQPVAVLTRVDLIAGNGGSLINAGSPVPTDRAVVGQGGSINNVKLTTDIGDVRANVAIKSYDPNFVSDVLRSAPDTQLTSETGNVGLVAGAAGLVKNGLASASGVNGSVSNIEARNIMSMVAGSVDRISSIVTLGKVTLTQPGGILGAFKTNPIMHPANEPLYFAPDGVTQVPTAIPGGRLMDGAILTRQNNSGLSSIRLFSV